MKKIAILTIAAFFAFSAFAGTGSSNDRTSNWHQNRSSSSTGGLISAEDEELNAPGVPVGEGLFILSLLSGGYALLRNRSWKSVKFRIK